MLNDIIVVHDIARKKLVEVVQYNQLNKMHIKNHGDLMHNYIIYNDKYHSQIMSTYIFYDSEYGSLAIKIQKIHNKKRFYVDADHVIYIDYV